MINCIKHITIIAIFSILCISLIGCEANNKRLVETYKTEGNLFGELDSVTNTGYSEFIDRDLGQFVIFYKYGDIYYSDANITNTHNIYYLAYEKVSKGVYMVTLNSGSLVFEPLLDENGNVYNYDNYINKLKGE